MVVEQKGLDVAVTIFGTDGKKIVEVDSVPANEKEFVSLQGEMARVNWPAPFAQTLRNCRSFVFRRPAIRSLQSVVASKDVSSVPTTALATPFNPMTA